MRTMIQIENSFFALAEATRDGNDPNASGEELVALVTRGYRCIRWVEKKFSLVWAEEGGGFSLEDTRTVKLELAGKALERAVAAAVSLEQAAGGGGTRGSRSPSPARRRSKRG